MAYSTKLCRALALSSLVAALCAGCRHGPPARTGGSAPVRASDRPGQGEGARAQAQALLRLAEVEPSRLNADQQLHLVRLVSEQRCPCTEVSSSLDECAGQPRERRCLRAPFAVRAIVRGILRGDSDDVIANRLLERFGPREPEEVALEPRACRGRAEAPVVLVLFSDFQCPFCAMAGPIVAAVEQAAKDQLRVCFKHWPLTRIHPNAQLAAQAAVAAELQGKFWEMHDWLFSHQQALGSADLLEHAQKLGLEANRFKSDLYAKATEERVAKDAGEAMRLRLEGTPSFLVNGRRMTDPKTAGDLLDWIAEALALERAKARGGASTQPAAGR